MRGGEKVLEALCDMYPTADIFTLLHVPGSVSPTIERHRITTSFVQRLPFAPSLYRHYLPLFPFAVERLDLASYDLIISSSHCVAKAVIPPNRALHLSYCHSPMRYAWDQFDAYFGPDRVGSFASRWFYRPVLGRLARWDAATANRVNRFAANSAHVAARIRRYYNRVATIVHPPVDTTFYHPADVAPETHFLMVSALVPYKRVDLAITACHRAGAVLRIVGDGPDRARLERRAAPGVTFLGALSDEQIRDEYRRARAVILPGEEDFGMVPVEAQACGTPVVALARGGALETVVDRETGVLVADASVEAMVDALEQIPRMAFDTTRIRRHAEQFSRERFVRQMRMLIDDTVNASPGTRW
jgi:glycosyltransferase involved in cell wall biosynthesis